MHATHNMHTIASTQTATRTQYAIQTMLRNMHKGTREAMHGTVRTELLSVSTPYKYETVVVRWGREGVPNWRAAGAGES